MLSAALVKPTYSAIAVAVATSPPRPNTETATMEIFLSEKLNNLYADILNLSHEWLGHCAETADQ